MGFPLHYFCFGLLDVHRHPELGFYYEASFFSRDELPLVCIAGCIYWDALDWCAWLILIARDAYLPAVVHCVYFYDQCGLFLHFVEFELLIEIANVIVDY